MFFSQTALLRWCEMMCFHCSDQIKHLQIFSHILHRNTHWHCCVISSGINRSLCNREQQMSVTHTFLCAWERDSITLYTDAGFLIVVRHVFTLGLLGLTLEAVFWPEQFLFISACLLNNMTGCAFKLFQGGRCLCSHHCAHTVLMAVKSRVDVSELIIKGTGRSSHASLKGKDLRKSVCHCLSPFNCYKLHSLVTLLGILVPFLVLGWTLFCLRFHGIDSTRCLKYSSTVYKP